MKKDTIKNLDTCQLLLSFADYLSERTKFDRQHRQFVIKLPLDGAKCIIYIMQHSKDFSKYELDCLEQQLNRIEYNSWGTPELVIPHIELLIKIKKVCRTLAMDSAWNLRDKHTKTMTRNDLIFTVKESTAKMKLRKKRI